MKIKIQNTIGCYSQIRSNSLSEQKAVDSQISSNSLSLSMAVIRRFVEDSLSEPNKVA
jgi:hypothetical protein